MIRLALAATALLWAVLPLSHADAQETYFSYDAAGNLVSAGPAAGSSVSPTIHAQPSSAVSGIGGAASFSVVAIGSAPLAYQWFFNGAPIPGATASTLFIPSVTGASFGGYSATVSNGVGSVSSGTAQLLLDSVHSGLPDAWQMQYFGGLTQTAGGSYDFDGVSNWLKFYEGVDPTNPATTRLTLTVSSPGDVMVEPNQADYAPGQQVTLTVVPDANLQFAGWGGDASGTTNPLTVTMDGNLEISASYTVPLAVALDNAALIWTAPDGPAWFGELDVSHDNISAGQSASLPGAGHSALGTTVTGPGIVGFWWQAQSNPQFNWLAFSIDGVEMVRISGSTGWTQQFFAIASGDHTLAWTYVKTAPAVGDADAGRVDEVTFVAAGASTLSMPLAVGITSNGAVLTGAVTLTGPDTVVHFEYGTTTNYGTSTPSQDLGLGTSSSSIHAAIGGLNPNTQYYWRIVSVAGGQTYYWWQQQTFTTTQAPPSVTTLPATAPASDSATLNASVNPNGGTAYVRFDYGLDTNYGASTPNQTLASGRREVAVTANLSGLQQNATYHFRAVAIGAGGQSTGQDQTFSTGATFVVLYNFTGDADGKNPRGLSAPGSDGCFYGVTTQGGADGVGTAYKISPTGALTPLYAFQNQYGAYLANDVSPDGFLTKGVDGDFYGVTKTGGPQHMGTVFRLTPEGELTTLYRFGGTDGSSPGRVMQASDLCLYGVTQTGGQFDKGTVYKIAADGTFTVLHSFNGADGSNPYGQLVQGNDGLFYGTTVGGGYNGGGTVFTVDPNGVFNTLHLFSIGEGTHPSAGLLLGSDGNFYGVAADGGSNPDKGTMFTVTPDGTLTVLHSFNGADGATPTGLVNGNDGYFYGATESGRGVLFRASADGNGFSVIHAFNGSDGDTPDGGLTLGLGGNIYGTTNSGGSSGDGTVFRVTISTFSILDPSNVGADCATLNALVNPNGRSTQAWFEYGTTSAYGRGTLAQTLDTAFGSVPVFANVTGLVPNTVYHYQFVEVSGGVTLRSADQTFTTASTFPSTPTLVPTGATGVTTTGANLTALINPNGTATTAWFEYGTTDTYGNPTNHQFLGQGSATIPFLSSLTNLLPNTTYHYRLVAIANGTIAKPDQTFTTLPPLPVITTNPASQVYAETANLAATARPNGAGTMVSFQYGTTAAYGNTTGAQYVSGTASDLSLNSALVGLAFNTTYHFRAVATSAGGTVTGADRAFSTSAVPSPVATTGPAANVTCQGATLTGTVNPNGLRTFVHFNYGLSAAYGMVSGIYDAGLGVTNVGIHIPTAPLAAATTYHFQIVAENSSGTTIGADSSFTTANTTLGAQSVAATSDRTPGFAGVSLSTFGGSSIDTGGVAAFRATVNGPGVTSANNTVLCTDFGSSATIVARTGAAAPGVKRGVFESFSDIVLNNSHRAAFVGTLRSGGAVKAANRTGIWSNASGKLALVARAGAPAGGCPAKTVFASFSKVVMPDGAGPVFLAKLAHGSGGVTAANDTGIWSVNAKGTQTLLVRVGATICARSASSVITALCALTSSAPNADDSTFNKNGTVAVVATFADRSQSVLQISRTGVIAAVASTKDAASGIPGATFTNFANAELNSARVTAVRASVQGLGVNKTSNSGIWTCAGNVRKLLARTGKPAPGVPGGVFAAFGDPAINNQGKIAFAGKLTSNALGIWTNTSRALKAVATTGAQAPGCPAGATFSSFQSLALPDQGGPVIAATLRPGAGNVTSSNNKGIWQADGSGNLSLIARTGDTVSINGTVRTISDISIFESTLQTKAQPGGCNQQGDLILRVTFGGGFQALITSVTRQN